MRPTLVDIARMAGVSTATVDRVLNGREGVRERTRSRVTGAARSLGYIDPERAAAEPEPVVTATPVELDFVLPGGTNTFLNNFTRHLEDLAALRDDVRLRVHVIDGFNPDAVALAIYAIRPSTQGVALVGLDHPTVREAIRARANAGTPVMTLISDISHVPRSGYVGIDNRAAGRLAGHLLGRFLRQDAGKVALFAGSLSYRGHEEREMGFRHLLQEDYPGMSVVELREVRDDSERAYAEAKALLGRYPDLAGIYNIGAGNRGIARALEEAGRARSTVFIGHELTEHTRRFLLSGTMDAVIDQNPRVEAREAIDQLARRARAGASPGDIAIRIQAIFRENLPD